MSGSRSIATPAALQISADQLSVRRSFMTLRLGVVTSVAAWPVSRYST